MAGPFASIFQFGVLFAEFFLLFNLALGGLACIPSWIYLAKSTKPHAAGVEIFV